MPNENRYVIDPESAAEFARLLKQERLFTTAMGGLLPEQPMQFRHVLDLACGPGGWALDLAQQAPGADVVGIDISQVMIEYANAQAVVSQLSNAHFEVGDITEGLPFADGSFDLVNARYIVGFMRRDAWPELLKECLRVLEPGGTIRLTEMETAETNAHSYETLNGLLSQAMYRRGMAFSEVRLGATAMLRHFLQQAGCEHIQEHPSLINYSYGAESHQEQYQNNAIIFKLTRPFILKFGLINPEDYDRWYELALKEMRSEDFCAVSFMNTAWGTKPTSASSSYP
ncbi:MAG: methyltransferase domain-containing protein [Ktedonobacteraceae bacterium]|nr:methyltransferase domain-containing protein [Ktedonobacteraceae bacterium]